MNIVVGGAFDIVDVVVGSEQALALVRYPDTFAEGAWDKLPKTKGTFDFVPQVITFATLYKNYIDFLFGSC